MKPVMKVMMGLVMMVISFISFGQSKVDDMRMEQDIEIAENILSTLVRQQFGRRNFFPMEVEGSYMSGYGVTLRLPQGSTFGWYMRSAESPNIVYNQGANGYTYTISGQALDEQREAAEIARGSNSRTTTALKSKAPKAKANDADSVSESIDKKFLEVAKNFLADYGDVISQLGPDEKIIITNRGDDFGGNFGFRLSTEMGARQSMMSAEARREDIIQLKQGKISRDQFLSKLKVVNTETSDKLDPDLEVLSSMFSRLYREDLSKTYYSQGDVSYERLKDFGVIYYMRVYSSVEDGEMFRMPTLSMTDVSQADRDKKVKELYPKFESELKENMIEYGRTLRSLKDDEQVMFKVRLTKCVQCAIPSSIELSVKNSVLKDYSSGKITKDAALSKVIVKKTGNQ
ncbi:MAG: hypothetical protein HOP08_19195 [Cyclobacteriaceae bacterium]|nr:hypothetical protein [Cyclobacteriaceae bacterium]